MASKSPFSDKQAEFLKTPLADFNILWGTTGSGKSYITNVFWYYFICELVPKNTLLFMSGYSNETLYDNVIRELLKLDEQDGKLDFKSKQGGERLYVAEKNIELACIGANSERAQGRVQGKNAYAWLGDEITKQPKSFVEMALSRLRWEIDGKMKVMPCIWTLNADSPSHYIKTDYIDKSDNECIRTWVFTFEDNPLIDEKYVEEQKKRFSGVFYERMIMNRWTMAEGAVYDNFSRDICVDHIDENRIQEWYIAIDWGYENPLAMLLVGRDGDGVYYVVDEFYERHRLIDKDLIQSIANKGWMSKKITGAIGDPSRPDYLRQIQELTSWNVSAANNDVIEGIQEVQKKLIKRGNGEYGLYISNNCQNVIKEFEQYVWKKGRDGIGKDEPEKTNDHAMDALRYVIYTTRQVFNFKDAEFSVKKNK